MVVELHFTWVPELWCSASVQCQITTRLTKAIDELLKIITIQSQTYNCQNFIVIHSHLGLSLTLNKSLMSQDMQSERPVLMIIFIIISNVHSFTGWCQDAFSCIWVNVIAMFKHWLLFLVLANVILRALWFICNEETLRCFKVSPIII